MKRVRVTMTVDYVVPDYVMEGNGQTYDQVKTDWFERFNINYSHATRDNCCIHGSKQIVSIEELDDEE